MFRSMFTVGSLTMVSRLLGFVRDKLIATHLGTGPMGDVWVAVFRLPNLFRRTFGEGAFNAAFVPMYGRRIEEGGEAAADDFARRTVSLMFTVLAVLFVLIFIFMEPVVKATNWGFMQEGDVRLAPAIDASRITAGYLVFICLVAALSGILNTRRVFGAPAFAYVVLNLVLLAALFWVIPKTGAPVTVLSWAVLASGVLQLALVLGTCIRRGVDLRPRLPVIDEDMKRLGILMAPGLVSAGVQQINLMVGQAVGSLQSGANSMLYYADRINQLPLGLIGMAAAVVLLPEITRSLRGGDEAGAKRSLLRGIEVTMLLCLPAAAAMTVIPQQIIHAVFEGGEFGRADSAETGRVLAAFALGTPAYVLVRVLQPGYFAREDTRTPMRFTIASAVVNLILVYPLFLALGPTGCALATSVAGWVNVALLWRGLRRVGSLEPDAAFIGRLSRMALASALMAAGVWGMASFGNDWIMIEGRFWSRLGSLGIVVAAGAGLYFALVVALRVYSAAQLRSLLKRARRK